MQRSAVVANSQTAAAGTESERHLVSQLGRLIDRSDQFERFPSFQAIYEGLVAAVDGVDDGSQVLLMVPRRLLRILSVCLEDLLVAGPGLRELPRQKAVHGEAPDHDAAAVAENGKRPLEVRGTCGGCGFDDTESAVPKAQNRYSCIFGFDVRETCGSHRGHCFRGPHYPLQDIDMMTCLV